MLKDLFRQLKSISPSLVFFFFAAIGLWRTFYFPASQSRRYAFGPGFWPRIICLLLILVTIFHVLNETKRSWKAFILSQGSNRKDINGDNGSYESKHKSEEAGLAKDSIKDAAGTIWKVLPGILIGIAYVYMIPRIGFFIATPIVLMGFMFLLGARHWFKILFSVSLVEGFMLLVFVRLLYLPIPEGTFPIFRAANLALINLVS